MKNKEEIVNVSRQLSKITERICDLAEEIDKLQPVNADLADTYEAFLIDEVTHVQISALELTRFVTGEENANVDESAFAEGELNSVVGEKEEGRSGSKGG